MTIECGALDTVSVSLASALERCCGDVQLFEEANIEHIHVFDSEISTTIFDIFTYFADCGGCT
jgi:hypothetical protein